MLKPYDKQEDVPEALREHYSKREDGKWHADIPDDHPAVKHNAKLLTEKQTAETKVTQLTSDLDSARAGNLGRGQVAATKSDMELLIKYKALGEPDALTATVTEHKTLKEESTKRKTDDNNRLAAKELGYNPDAFLQLTNLPEFKINEKDGKKTVVALVKNGENTVEKPAKEFIESTYAPLMPALTAKAGVELPVGGGSGGETSGDDPYKWATDFAKNYTEQSKPVGDPYKAFNERQSA